MQLKDRVILVTGAGSVGVGHGVAQAVAEAGGRVVINDIDEDRARAAAAQFPQAVVAPGDVSKAEDVNRIFDVTLQHCGRVDGLVNNAGVGLSRSAHEVTEAEFDRLHSVDLRGVWLMSRAFIQHCLNAKASGSIVNISSVMAMATIPRYAVYASAKAGVEGLTRGLAIEGGPHDIRCNAVAPGYVHSEQNMELIATWTDDPAGWVEQHTTDQQALPRLIDAIDCGRLVAFLLSDAARCITAQTIRVDCGMTAMLYNRKFV